MNEALLEHESIISIRGKYITYVRLADDIDVLEWSES